MGLSSAARGPPTRANSRRAGVAQSVAQLSCKQQVRGSSPLASSKFAWSEPYSLVGRSHLTLWIGQTFTVFHTPLCVARMVEAYMAPAAARASSWLCTYVAMVKQAVA